MCSAVITSLNVGVKLAHAKIAKRVSKQSAYKNKLEYSGGI
ncbi:hypothetical protein PMAN_a0189 [Pseudoalteromonas marina]|nr:hypothetical protein PMAN_a0189 [Pseudoalteromonas marina]